jgi:photosynthetic reaction center H subunit
MPINFARIDPRKGRVRTRALTAAQIARVPAIASDSQITKREEDRICGYWAGGFLYATPDRQEPLL